MHNVCVRVRFWLCQFVWPKKLATELLLRVCLLLIPIIMTDIVHVHATFWCSAGVYLVASAVQ